MPQKRKADYFIEPLDGHTKRKLEELSDRFSHVGMKRCSDDVMRGLWKCALASVRYLEGYAEQFDLRFKSYEQADAAGEISLRIAK